MSGGLAASAVPEDPPRWGARKTRTRSLPEFTKAGRTSRLSYSLGLMSIAATGASLAGSESVLAGGL